MLVKMVHGAYRYLPQGEKYAVVVTANEPAFDLPPEEAERLIALGVAQYAQKAVATAQTDEEAPLARETPATTPDAAKTPIKVEEDEQPDDEELTPEYSLDMTAAQLRAIMENHDIPVEKKMTKAEMVDALDDRFDDAPRLGASSVVE